jgi:hypothetical protein
MFSPMVLPLAVMASEVQVLRDFLHHHRQAAGVAEVFHQVLARGLQVHQAGQFAGEPVEVVERQFHADAARDGDQVDHRVGGAADRGQRLDRVLEWLGA